MWLPTVDFESTASAVSPPRHRPVCDAESSDGAGILSADATTPIERFCQSEPKYPSELGELDELGELEANRHGQSLNPPRASFLISCSFLP